MVLENTLRVQLNPIRNCCTLDLEQIISVAIIGVANGVGETNVLYPPKLGLGIGELPKCDTFRF